MFAQAGPVQSVRVMRDKATGQSRGFAFVEMESEEAARAAIDKFNETEVDGRRLTVNEARPQTVGAGRSFGGAPANAAADSVVAVAEAIGVASPAGNSGSTGTLGLLPRRLASSRDGAVTSFQLAARKRAARPLSEREVS